MRRLNQHPGQKIDAAYVVNPLEHAGLAYAEARRFRSRTGTREDLLQAALLGLCTAARTYDPSRGSFSHHATVRVRAELSAAVMADYRHGRFGGGRMTRKVVFQLSRLDRQGRLNRETAREALTNCGEEFTTLKDLEIDRAIAYVRRGEARLDAPAAPADPDGPTLSASLAAPDTDPAQGLVGRDWYRALEGVLAGLTPTARGLFERCAASEETSLAEVAREVGSTRQNISQVMRRIRKRAQDAAALLELAP